MGKQTKNNYRYHTMTATKTIRVLKTTQAIRALFKANVPSFVVEKIVGMELPADDSCNVEYEWLGRQTMWCLPPDAVELVTKQ